MKYYTLSQLVKKGIDINPIINEILLMTISAKETYPEYIEWFTKKHVPGIYAGTRDTIIVVDNNNLVGVANIKNDCEKKLCTLYFRPEYRYRRVAKILVDQAINLLETTQPLITIPSTSISGFTRLIKRYNWQLTDCINDCYSNGVNEFIFNGEIALPNKELSHEERLILTYEHTKDKNILKLLPFGYLQYLIFRNKKARKSVEKILNS